MSANVKIIGLRQTIRGLNKIKRNFDAFKKGAVTHLGKETTEVARKNVPVDTGALKESIRFTITQDIPDDMKLTVQAGSNAIARGQGRFQVDRTGNKVSHQPTSQYAEAAEEKTKYMDMASQFTAARITKVINEAIERAINVF